VVIAVMAVVLHRTVVGRWIYATGSNPRGAELALVPTRWVWVGCFAVSALFSAMTGVLLAAFAGGGDSTIGDPYLYTALTAVIVGGTAFGAHGDYTRTALGALLLTALTTVMIGHGFNTADQQILSGVLILLMVAFYARDRRIRDRI
jgi:ribose transport system permease protein